MSLKEVLAERRKARELAASAASTASQKANGAEEHEHTNGGIVDDAVDRDSNGSVEEIASLAAPEITLEAITQQVISAETYTHPSQPDRADNWQAMQRAFQMLEQSLHDRAAIEQSLAYIMSSIQNDPALMNNMVSENYGLMVRSLRLSYGIAIEKKVGKRAATSERALKREEVADDILGGMDLSIFRKLR